MRWRAAHRIACAAWFSLAGSIGLAAPVDEGILIDQLGRAVPASALHSRVLLVYFGFSHCAEICPASLLTMGRALQLLGHLGDDVLPLFVSIDPLHDTPAVMRRYLSHFDPRIRGLTGTPASVADAARSFAAQFQRVESASGAPQFDHSIFIYLADRHGKVARRFLSSEDPAAIASALRASLAAQGTP